MSIPNQQWQWVIVSPDGEVTGTDNVDHAKQHALNDDMIVISIPTCTVLTGETETDEDDDGNEISEDHFDSANIAEDKQFTL